MPETKMCPKCGAELPGNAPLGICPTCLMQAGLASEQDAGSGLQIKRTAAASGFVPPTPEELGPQFPQLEILELLGKGGMGAVYKARQPGLDRLVALKILPPEISHDPAFAERFQREARALAKLSHPHIVAVYDFGQTGERQASGGRQPSESLDAMDNDMKARRVDTPRSPEGALCYIVMEFVDGANLRQTIRAGRLTSQEALAIVPQICEALQFAHDEGVVHRDIKPENILIDKRGRVKIADFGLAKLLGQDASDHSLTATHQVMGTLRYMAPEQMQGSREVDHRADIYSLGVVFYELLTGELPMGKFAPPSKKVHIDVRLDEVVLRALEQEPEQRYQHASDVKTDVDAIVQSGMASSQTKRVEPTERVTLEARLWPRDATGRMIRLIRMLLPGVIVFFTTAAGILLILFTGNRAYLAADFQHKPVFTCVIILLMPALVGVLVPTMLFALAMSRAIRSLTINAKGLTMHCGSQPSRFLTWDEIAGLSEFREHWWGWSMLRRERLARSPVRSGRDCFGIDSCLGSRLYFLPDDRREFIAAIDRFAPPDAAWAESLRAESTGEAIPARSALTPFADSGRATPPTIVERELRGVWRWVAGDAASPTQPPAFPGRFMILLSLAGCLMLILPWLDLHIEQDANIQQFWSDAEMPGSFSRTLYGSERAPGIAAGVAFGLLALLLIMMPGGRPLTGRRAAVMSVIAACAVLPTFLFKPDLEVDTFTIPIVQHEDARFSGLSGASSGTMQVVGEPRMERVMVNASVPLKAIEHQIAYREGFYGSLALSIALLVLSGIGVRHAVAWGDDKKAVTDPVSLPIDGLPQIRRQLRWPGALLMLNGALILLPAALCFTNGFDISDGNDAEPAAVGFALMGLSFLLLIVTGLVVRGGWHMLAVESHRAALLGSFLGQPIGLWGLFVLSRPEIKAAFAMPTSHARNSARPKLVPLFATMNLLGAIVLMLVCAMEDSASVAESVPQIWQTWEKVDAVLGFTMAAGMFAASIGLFLWKPWARKLTLGVCVFGLASFVFDAPYLARFAIPDLHAEVQRTLAEEGVDPAAHDFVAMLTVVTLIGGVMLVGLTWLIGQLVYFTRPRVVAAFASPNENPSRIVEWLFSGAGAIVGLLSVFAPLALLIGLAAFFDDSSTVPRDGTSAGGTGTPEKTGEVWFGNAGQEHGMFWSPNSLTVSDRLASHLGLDASQRAAMNQAFQTFVREFQAIEVQNTRQETDANGHQITTITAFPQQITPLAERFWSELESSLDGRQLTLGRKEVNFRGGMFWDYGYRIEIWRVGQINPWYHWMERYPGLANVSQDAPQSAPELPEKLRRFWKEPAADNAKTAPE